tara:strand:- start:4259 stop:4732 length:474 start_codon:yes stop_codon:yes gene_type:complete
MPYNSTKVTNNNQNISTKGGTFEGVNVFNGATASIVYISDNNNEPSTQVSTYNNDPTVTVEDSSAFAVGDLVTGTGIPVDTKVLSITDSTTVELTASTTGGNTNGPLQFHSLANLICKFHIAANTTYFYRGFNVVCRNGIKISSSDWSNLEIFALHN